MVETQHNRRFLALFAYRTSGSFRLQSFILALIFALSSILSPLQNRTVLAAPQAEPAARPGPAPAPGPVTVQLPSADEAPLTGSLGSNRFAPPQEYNFANGLSIKPITAYNLVVDSNVLSPSSYGPSAATLGAQYCNTSGALLSNVWAYIGDYDAQTPGTYPGRPAASITENSSLQTAAYTDIDPVPSPVSDGAAVFKLKHESGSANRVADASRYIGTLAPNECRTEYWLISYPRKAYFKSASPVTVTGGIKPSDDLWLSYHFWGKVNNQTAQSYYKLSVTMRNEISAMANKIWPNGDNKVPQQYLDAIQQAFGWATLTPNGGNTAYPGQLVTSQGIWYDLGNVGAGFDNNGDLVPDHNGWLQPIGDAAAYDPGCFRLVRTYGIIIVKLIGGGELLIPFLDQTYFQNIPDNNGVVGLVYYQYAALDGACTAALTPYQEVASGYDNEKFNADFGAGLPPLQSTQTNLTFQKLGDGTVATGGMINYSMTFELPQDDSPTQVVSVGSPALGIPLVFQETIPAGTTYRANTAAFATSTDVAKINMTLAGTILFSHDNGATFTTDQNPVNTVTHIQWWLNAPVNSQDSARVIGGVKFAVDIPVAYTPPTVTDTGCLKLGNGSCFTQSTFTTLVTGTYQIQGTVFKDDGAGGGTLADGVKNGSEAPITSASYTDSNGNGSKDAIEPAVVSLYYDADNNNKVNAGDMLIATTTTTNASPNYTFSGLPLGRYVVKVDPLNAEIQALTGYVPTTPVELDADIEITPQNPSGSRTGIDFGFAPALTLNKRVENPTTNIYVGDTVQYTITLTNVLPGDGDGGTACTYRVWSRTANQGAGTPPGGGNANAQFASPTSAQGYPDGTYASSNMKNNADTIGFTGFTTVSQPGSIQSVKLVAYIKEVTNLADGDQIVIRPYFGATQLGTGTTYTGNAAPFNGGGTGAAYKIVSANIDPALLPAASAGHPAQWLWSDFQGSMGAQVYANGTSSPGDIGIDAVAFEITTDQNTCGGASTVLNPAQLDDAFDPTKLQLISANPPYTNSTTESATQTKLHWENVGPIYPGQAKQVMLTFKALATTSSATRNTASSAGDKYANGAPANTPPDSFVDINLKTPAGNGSISGVIWDDNNDTGWPNVSTTGFDAADGFIPYVKVDLYACRTSDGTFITNANNNDVCTTGGGSWQLYGTTYSQAATGAYTFTGLPYGYYRVIVDASTVASGQGSQTGDPNLKSGKCSSTTPTSCDSQSGLETDKIQGMLGAVNATTPNPANINFGYAFPSGSNSTIGDTLYYDWNGSGTQDPSEASMRNVDVLLYRLSDLANANPAPFLTATTDSSGRYCFGGSVASCATPTAGLPAGIYVVKVKTNDADFPAGKVLQTQDPDETGVCSNCDSASRVILDGATANLNQDFGYQPTGPGQIGDTIFADKNGNGVQDATAETGIRNVTVTLQVDFYNDGTWSTAKTTQTDSSGKYLFIGLPDAKYRVIVDGIDADIPLDAFGKSYVPTTGLQYTAVLSGGVVTTLTNEASTVCSALANGCSNENLVEKDPVSLDADFGFAPLAAIGDTIFWDSNGNGTQDSGEPGINGARVNLYKFTDSNANHRYDPGEPLVGTPVSTITATDPVTGLPGKYLFSGLSSSPAGVAYVVVVDTTSDLDPAASGVQNPLLNATRSTDPDANGFACPVLTEPASAGQPTKLVCDDSTGMLLYPGSNFMGADFGYLPTSAVIGDSVWVDSNGNGLREAGEAGIPGAQVYLCTSTLCNVINPTRVTVTTDADGYYYFTNVANGTYYLAVEPADIPAGLAPQTYEADGTINNQTQVVVNAGVVTIPGNSCTTDCNMKVDFGYHALVGTNTISGAVCLDDPSANGLCANASDLGYAGVSVYLYSLLDNNNNGKYDTGDSLVLAGSTLTSGPTGAYSFANLPVGKFMVSLNTPESNLALTTTLASLGASTSELKPTLQDSKNPSSPVVSAWQVVNVNGDVVSRDFAFKSTLNYDYGDLPDSYHTSLAADGARHAVLATPDLYLGTSSITTEFSGTPGVNASGDAYDDGVTFNSPQSWVTGNNTQAVTVNFTGSGWLVGWMDFKQNGSFTDAGEMIANQAVSSSIDSPLQLNLNVPAGTFGKNGDVALYSRFRLFPSQPVLPSVAFTGAAANGEVEDYLLTWKMAVDKKTTTPSVFPGGEIVYTITVSNTGSQPVTGVQVSDNLAAIRALGGFTYVDQSTRVVETSATRTATSDPAANATNLSWGSWSIQPGGSVAVTFRVKVDSSVPDDGSTVYNNAASASSYQNGTIIDNGAATDEDVKVMPSADLYVTKDDGQTAYTAGSTVTYTIRVGNHGPSDVTGATFTDPLIGITNLASVSWTCAGTNAACPRANGTDALSETVNLARDTYLDYTVTAVVAAAPTGDLVNTATVVAPTNVADSDSTNNSWTDTDKLAALALSKTAAPTTFSAAGQVINYTYTLQNTGQVALTSPYTVSDDKVLPANINCTGATSPLAVGASTSCTGTYTTTAADVTAGSVTNKASATATMGSLTITSKEATATISQAVLSLAKTGTLDLTAVAPATRVDVGDRVNYTLTASNTGKAPLTGLALTDPKIASLTCAWPGAAGNLAVGQSVTCTGAYALTAADLTAGSVVNMASASSNETTTPVTAAKTVTLPSANLSLTKTVDNTAPIPGTNVVFTITVANSGPNTATNVTVKDVLPVGLQYVSNDAGSAYNSATGIWTVGTLNTTTPAVLKITAKVTSSGTSTNSAQVLTSDQVDPNSTPANDSTTEDDDDAVTLTTVAPQADLYVEKTNNQTTYTAGSPVTYIIKVGNNGPSDVTGATFTDALVTNSNLTNISWTCAGANATCPRANGTDSLNETVNLVSGASLTYTVTATVVAAPAGDLLNMADVTAPAGVIDSPTNNNTAKDTDTPVLASIGDRVWNDADGNGAQGAGETGINGVTVSLLGAGPDNTFGNGDDLTAIPSQTTSGDGNYTFTGLQPGTYRVSVTETGPLNGYARTGGSNPQTVTLTTGQNYTTADFGYRLQAPGFTISKTASPTSVNQAGAVINYTITLRNTGNMALTGVTVSDPLVTNLAYASGDANTKNILDIGESWSYSGSYTVKQADIDTGTNLVNTATADTNETNPPQTAQATVTVTQTKGISLNKTPSPATYTKVGDTITYQYVITNSGNTTLTGQFTVSDDHINSGTAFDCGGTSVLAPNATRTCTATYTITQADLDAGSLTNTATVTNGSITSSTTSATVNALSTKALTLTKTATPVRTFYQVGQVITYQYVLQNTGNITLAGPFTISDDHIGTPAGASFACTSAASLAPGASLTCTATYTITQADLNAGSVTNKATGSGGGLISSQVSETITRMLPGSITGTVFNDADGNGAQGAGENGLSGVEVALYDSTGNTLIQSTVTQPGGGYSFTNIPAGDYRVVETDLSGFISTTPNGHTASVPPGGSAVVNFGDYRLTSTMDGAASIRGLVYHDANNNGKQDTGESPLSGVTVKLLNSAGTVVGTTQTGADGAYSFANLTPGTYTVEENDPNGYTSTTLNHVSVSLIAGANPQVDFGDLSGSAVITDPAVTKFGSPASAQIGDTVIYTITVGNNGSGSADNVILNDVKPAFLDILAVSVSPDPGLAVNLTGSGFSINFGTVRPVDFYTITVLTRVNSLGLPPGGANNVTIRTVSTGDRSFNNLSTADLQITSRTTTSSKSTSTSGTLPSTGFAPDRVTGLPPQPAPYAATDLAMEIPALGLKTSVVGIPRTKTGWDVTWLGSQAGYLEGTAFPTWEGNSVITGHVYNANGLPGLFVNLGKLKWGDQIILHAFGQKYIYAVRSVADIQPDDPSALRHEDKAWLTLLTCKQYDEKTGAYKLRTVAKAVLVQVVPEK